MRASRKAGQAWLIGVLSAVGLAGQEFTISTLAGGAPPPTPAPATTVSTGKPTTVAVDAAGNVYFAVEYGCVFKLDSAGILTRVAGIARWGSSGDGGPATSAQIGSSYGIALDASGNVYIADTSNNRVRRVSSAGIITTVAGTGDAGFSGDGGPATSARLRYPYGIALDPTGNLYIADAGNTRIRRVSSAGIITTVAGTGEAGFSGDGGPAMSAQLRYPNGIALDAAGNVYIADTGNNRLRRISTSGVISTVADGLSGPYSVAVNSAGTVFVADTGTSRVLRLIGPNMFTPVAGIGEGGFSGDGGLGTNARLTGPTGIAVDAAGNLYIADRNNYRVRRVSAPSGMAYTGIISTVAGNGTYQYSGDGGMATAAQLSEPYGVAVDGTGNVYIADYYNSRLRRVSPSGMITTVAGTGVCGYSGDGGPATSAELCRPTGVTVDTADNVYFADDATDRVRRISPAGVITTVAGNGTSGFSGDGGLATSAQFHFPHGLAVSAGYLYIADVLNDRIRRVSPATPFSAGTITTVAGSGVRGFSGDGGPATSAQLSLPHGVAVDTGGNLYIADGANNRVRRVSTSGIITTVAGNGEYSGGDVGPATSVGVGPYGVALDAAGNLYIADATNRRIRRVSTSGIITTIAGTGDTGYSGDGGPARSAELWVPRHVAVDSAGRIYFSQGNAVRVLTPSNCTTSASPTAFTAPPGGGQLILTIQAAAGCGWNITGLPAWVTASSTSGLGPATVTLNIAANPLAARSTTITAAGTAVTISQDMSGGVCVPPSISPASQVFSSAGGTGYFTVSTRAGCGWTAVSQVAWITITSAASGSGDGAINYQVMPNTPGSSRSGTITVAGSTFTVQQTSSTYQCSYSINSADLGVAASGGTVTLSVRTDPGCAWSVSGLPAWLTVSGSSQGAGSASVSLVAASNPAGPRSASVSIGGVSVPIRQFDSSACGGSASCVARALPHVAAGGEWTTTVLAVNSGAAAASFSVSFHGDDGSSIALPFTGAGSLSALSDSVPAQGRKDYEAGSASSPLQGGWGLLVAEKSVTSQAAFRRAIAGGVFYEAAVPASEGYSGFMVPFDASAFPPTGGPLYTGFAIANLNPSAAAHVTCTARDQWGAVIPDAVTIPELKPSGHHANFLFPALTGKRGTLDCTADTLVSAIALRFIGTDAFSTLPVILK